MLLPQIMVLLLAGTVVYLVVVPVVLLDDWRRGMRMTAGKKILATVAGLLGFMYVVSFLLVYLAESH